MTPYGVYAIGANAGFVNVGTDHDTAAFAVESLRRWWQAQGKGRYPAARRLLVTCDAGGSNGYRTRAWKAGLAELAAETGLEITVCHFPPGTSKWNKIGHRLFCQITRNWRARPLASHQVILETIAATTTRTGLRSPPCSMTAPTPRRSRSAARRWRSWSSAPWPGTASTASGTTPCCGPPGRRRSRDRRRQPAGRCGQDTLNHPALTGMDPAGADGPGSRAAGPVRRPPRAAPLPAPRRPAPGKRAGGGHTASSTSPTTCSPPGCAST